MPSTPRVLIVLPCYNEGRSIGLILARIAKLRPACPVDALVIDDGSVDDTFDQASKVADCVRLVINLGIGGAVQTGIQFARDHGYDYCVQVDGDGQHPPEEIPHLLAVARETGAGLLIGSRFIGDPSFVTTAMRRKGIAVITTAFRVLYGVRLTDPTSGFRVLDRRAILLFSEQYPRDFPEPISIATAIIAGLPVRETSVRMAERAHGVSSISGWKNLAYMIRVLGNLAILRFHKLLP